MANAYGVSGTKLSQILLKSGIQVLHSKGEFIILDPGLITVVAYSEKPGGEPIPVTGAG